MCMQYTIKYGDTLRMIAQRELGDAELWTEIADLNNLSYPYISDTPADGVVTPGDTIYLPDVNNTSATEETSFGTDLALSTDKVNLSYYRGGDLTVGVDGDYQLVSELDCLRQDLAHRKMTPLGTVPYHPTYGSNLTTIIGSKKDENWKIKAQLEVERTLKCDPRVTDVKDVTIQDLPTGIRIDYTAVAKGIVFRGGGVGSEEI
jgi:phage baseplate assembly protein W